MTGLRELVSWLAAAWLNRQGEESAWRTNRSPVSRSSCKKESARISYYPVKQAGCVPVVY